MGFRGQEFAFDSPAAALKGMLARLENARGVMCERVPLESAHGRVLGEDIRCDRDSPAFDYSAMDGYAIRVADARGAKTPTLHVAGESCIGREPPTLGAGAVPVAIRVSTGAAIPPGADAVLKREDVIEHGGGSDSEACAGDTPTASITVSAAAMAKLRTGDNIRVRGENAGAGSVVLESGAVIDAAAIGTLAAVGVNEPSVFGRVRVTVITTGDELVSPDWSPSAYEVRNSNGPALRAMLSAHAWIDVVSVAHARDGGRELDSALRDAIARADAIVLTGGVSMGHRDPVRGAVERAGALIVFHGLPQRPGKPMLGAVVPGMCSPGMGATRMGVPVFGLPGNPISAMVTCRRIVLPVLAARAGVKHGSAVLMPWMVKIANPDGKTLDVWWHRPARLISAGEAELVEARGSGDIVAGGRSNGFVELPPGARAEPGVASAESVAFYPWSA